MIPLVSISIENNTIRIYQKKYMNSRRFEEIKYVIRYQNDDFYLIGSTYRYADTCDFDDTYHINFSTDNVI